MRPEQACVEVEEAVRSVQRSMKGIEESGLTERVLYTMLHDISGVGKEAIEKVVDALTELGDYALDSPTQVDAERPCFEPGRWFQVLNEDGEPTHAVIPLVKVRTISSDGEHLTIKTKLGDGPPVEDACLSDEWNFDEVEALNFRRECRFRGSF